MPHRNIPIFIPHLGCPNQCVFCNQRSISGCESFDESSVDRQIEQALTTIGSDTETEIAFFGGSFTGIDRVLMLRLLDTAQRYVDLGRVSSIRLSTRPDYINDEILGLLSRYSVKTIELGLQSMDDRVLAATNRGHSAKQAEDACRAVVRAGFTLVGQMMIGLPESDLQAELATAEKICALGASAARIYPTVVFYDTPLCRMAQSGRYTPLSIEQATVRAASALRVFLAHHVACIRIGLCSGESLTSDEAVYAGPNHPALGELVWSEYYYGQILDALERRGLYGKHAILAIERGTCSKVIGQRRANLLRLERETSTRIERVVERENLRGVDALPYHIDKKQ